MNKAQIALIGVATLAGSGAYFLYQPDPPPPAPAVVAAPAPVLVNQVLVAANAIEFGSVIDDKNVRWIDWPADIKLADVIQKNEKPEAIAELSGSVVRGQFLANEPIRTDRLIKGPSANFMSTLIGPGKRAVAINIDSTGSSSAGGFVLPNDRVDIIRTYRDEEASKVRGGEVYGTQVILQNVKVLAIGPNVQTKNGEAVIIGATATLELDPAQAEYVILSQRTGQLSLTLRPLTDALEQADATLNAPRAGTNSMVLVRFGVTSTDRSK